MRRDRSYRHSHTYCFVQRNVIAIVLLGLIASSSLLGQRGSSIPEETEWTWEVRPQHPDAKLPNVLLLGDSISRNYFPTVSQSLSGIANVYLMASSAAVGDPRLPRQIAEFAAMEGVHFSIVHFNNGMHGWDYSEAQYKSAFPSFLHAIRKLSEIHGVLIWATTTPVKTDVATGPTNLRIDLRNDIAISLVKADGIAIDDQHQLMMQHQDYYDGSVHFNAEGTQLQGDQVTTAIKAALHSKQQ